MSLLCVLSVLTHFAMMEHAELKKKDSRRPKGKETRKDYAEVIGADGLRLLTTLYDASALPHLRVLPAVQNLRRIWTFHYYTEEGQLRWHKAEDLPPASICFDSPYDPDVRFGNSRDDRRWDYR